MRLPEEYFVSIVVFPNQTKLNIEARDAVLHVYELADCIRNHMAKTPLTEEQISSSRELLNELTSTGSGKKQEHVEHVREKIQEKNEKINADICPRCGGKLILRDGKYGQFYGCSNYPRCGFTMQKK